MNIWNWKVGCSKESSSMAYLPHKAPATICAYDLIDPHNCLARRIQWITYEEKALRLKHLHGVTKTDYWHEFELKFPWFQVWIVYLHCYYSNMKSRNNAHVYFYVNLSIKDLKYFLRHSISAQRVCILCIEMLEIYVVCQNLGIKYLF